MIDSSGKRVSDGSESEAEKLLRSIRFIKKVDDPDSMATKKSLAEKYHHLACICFEGKEYEKALRYEQQAFPLYEELYRKGAKDSALNLAFAYVILRETYPQIQDDTGKTNELQAAEKAVAYFREAVESDDSDFNRKNYVIAICEHAKRVAENNFDKAKELYHAAIDAAEDWPETGSQKTKVFHIAWSYEKLFIFLKGKTEQEPSRMTEVKEEMETAVLRLYDFYRKYAELLPDSTNAQEYYALACDKARRFYLNSDHEDGDEKAKRFNEEENRLYFLLARHDPFLYFENFLLTSRWLLQYLNPRDPDRIYTDLCERMQRGCRKVTRYLDRRTAEGADNPPSASSEISLWVHWAEVMSLLASARYQQNDDRQEFIGYKIEVIKALEPRILWLRNHKEKETELMEAFFEAFRAIYDLDRSLITDDLQSCLRIVVKPVFSSLLWSQKRLCSHILTNGGNKSV